MAMHYTDSLVGLGPEMLQGFFESWKSPPPLETRWRMIRNSRHIWLAIDKASGKVVGLINAITDDANFAFIPLLEVLPEYRSKGIGTQLVQRMLRTLQGYPCIDLTCDENVQPFYERCGMLRSRGMVIRDYSRRGPQ